MPVGKRWRDFKIKLLQRPLDQWKLRLDDVEKIGDVVLPSHPCHTVANIAPSICCANNYYRTAFWKMLSEDTLSLFWSSEKKKRKKPPEGLWPAEREEYEHNWVDPRRMDSWVWAAGGRGGEGSRFTPPTVGGWQTLPSAAAPGRSSSLCCRSSSSPKSGKKKTQRDEVLSWRTFYKPAGKCSKTSSALTTMWLEKDQRNIIGTCFLALKEGQNHFSFSKRGSLL